MKKSLLLYLFTIPLIANAQYVGIGIPTPLTKLHIYTGASGTIPYSQFAPLAIESNEHTYINLLSPAANETAILFGSGSSTNGVLMYNTSVNPNGFQFRNNGNQTRMVTTIVATLVLVQLRQMHPWVSLQP